MHPSFEEVLAFAKKREYKRIPVAVEMLADSFTPIEVMRTLKSVSLQCFVLESACQSENWGRYSFLGFQPEYEITCKNHVMTIKETVGDTLRVVEETRVAHPAEVLRKILADYKTPKLSELPPFTGGLVGFFSYDYIKYNEPVLEACMAEGDSADLDFMLFQDVIAFDHFKQKIYLITGVMLPENADSEEAFEKACFTAYQQAEKKLLVLKKLLRSNRKFAFPPLTLQSELKPKFSEEAYGDMVKKAKEYIREGDIFQVVLSNPMCAKAEGSLFDTYRYLRSENPSPYMLYFSGNTMEIAGASPETLVSVQNGRVHTYPLAGTRPRGKDLKEDFALEQELLQDEKERAEHNMLVDLGRNDLGRIGKIGSVEVVKYMEIERFSHVMHIGSEVQADLQEGLDAIDAINAVLPAGTLSGAPKIRACEIIEELEGSKRGLYGGALGYLDFTGNADVCIAIRLAYKENDRVWIRSGAGIVADSVPEKEAQECINKAKAVVKAVEAANGGLE